MLVFDLLKPEIIRTGTVSIKKAVVLMGTNATGKTSLGRALLKIFRSIREANEAILRDLDGGEFQVDFVNEGFTLHRLYGSVDGENVSIRYFNAGIGERDSYEMAEEKLIERSDEVGGSFRKLKALVGPLEYCFYYPEIETSLRMADVKNPVLLKTLRAVIGTLDHTLTVVSIAKDLKDSFVIWRRVRRLLSRKGSS